MGRAMDGTAQGERLRVGLLTREFPPDVYGGAGVHAEFLARELRGLVDLDVHSWALGGKAWPGQTADSPGVYRHAGDPGLADANAALRTLSVDLALTAAVADRQLVQDRKSVV